MPKLSFSYNLKKDAWSWVLIAKEKNLWGLKWRDEVSFIPDELLNKIGKAGFSRAQKMVEKYIQTNPKNIFERKIMNFRMRALEQSWKLVEKKYFKTLASVTGKPVFRKSFGCYGTTGFMCPYSEKENWFMVSLWHSLPFSITTICHEMLHLQFLHYYKDYLKRQGLNKEQIEDLKEALTFLLNEPEFDSVILSCDDGYPEHQDLRKKLQKIWSRKKDFKELVEKGIALIKKT